MKVFRPPSKRNTQEIFRPPQHYIQMFQPPSSNSAEIFDSLKYHQNDQPLIITEINPKIEFWNELWNKTFDITFFQISVHQISWNKFAMMMKWVKYYQVEVINSWLTDKNEGLLQFILTRKSSQSRYQLYWTRNYYWLIETY